jgi:CRP/FNR family cyclic AMP-dependent transcriptional regulator
MAKYHDLVGEIDLFKPLSDKERRFVASQCSLATYGPQIEILGEGETSTDIFFVAEGEVSAKSYSASGREVTLNTIGRGRMFGEFSAVDGQPRSASIVTLTDAIIARMTSQAFREFLAQHPGVALLFAEHLVAKIRLLSHRVFEFSTLSASNRIRAELLRMCGEQANGTGAISIDPAPSHYELATRLSTHREAVSRELSFLASRKVIELGRRRIRVLDLERLMALAEAQEVEKV